MQGNKYALQVADSDISMQSVIEYTEPIISPTVSDGRLAYVFENKKPVVCAKQYQRVNVRRWPISGSNSAQLGHQMEVNLLLC